MSSSGIESLLKGWHFKRYLGLFLGLFLGGQALYLQDGFLGVLAFFFLFQSVTNTGCFGTNGCNIPDNRQSLASDNEEGEQISYTEIK